MKSPLLLEEGRNPSFTAAARPKLCWRLCSTIVSGVSIPQTIMLFQFSQYLRTARWCQPIPAARDRPKILPPP